MTFDTKNFTAWAAQAVDYTHVDWDGIGRLIVFTCPSPTSPFKVSEPGIDAAFLMSRLLWQLNVGELANPCSVNASSPRPHRSEYPYAGWTGGLLRSRTIGARRLPRWSDFTPLVSVGAPELSPTRRRLGNALVIEDLRTIARRRCPRSAHRPCTRGGLRPRSRHRRTRPPHHRRAGLRHRPLRPDAPPGDQAQCHRHPPTARRADSDIGGPAVELRPTTRRHPRRQQRRVLAQPRRTAPRPAQPCSAPEDASRSPPNPAAPAPPKTPQPEPPKSSKTCSTKQASSTPAFTPSTSTHP